jgi:hypothetical protein
MKPNDQPIRIAGVIIMPTHFEYDGVLLVRRGEYFGLPVVVDIPDTDEFCDPEAKSRCFDAVTEKLSSEIQRYGVARSYCLLHAHEYPHLRMRGIWGLGGGNGTNEPMPVEFRFYTLPGLKLICPFAGENIRVVHPNGPATVPKPVDLTYEVAENLVSEVAFETEPSDLATA